MVELAGDVHPAWCLLRHDRKRPHRSRRYGVGKARMCATAGNDWRPTLHVEGFPTAGPRLSAVESHLLNPAGNGH